MKPNPLPSNPKLIDRVAYALQWSVSWMIVDIKGRPMVSGLVPIYGIVIVILILTGHWKP